MAHNFEQIKKMNFKQDDTEVEEMKGIKFKKNNNKEIFPKKKKNKFENT